MTHLFNSDQLRILAGAKKPCPNLADLTSHLNPGSNIPPTFICNPCHSTGQVYILPDVVRKPCPQLNGYVYGKKHKNNAAACFLCHGSGWVASERLEDWLEAAKEVIGDGFSLSVKKFWMVDYRAGVVLSSSAVVAVMTALERWLEALNCMKVYYKEPR